MKEVNWGLVAILGAVALFLPLGSSLAGAVNDLTQANKEEEEGTKRTETKAATDKYIRAAQTINGARGNLISSPNFGIIFSTLWANDNPTALLRAYQQVTGRSLTADLDTFTQSGFSDAQAEYAKKVLYRRTGFQSIPGKSTRLWDAPNGKQKTWDGTRPAVLTFREVYPTDYRITNVSTFSTGLLWFWIDRRADNGQQIKAWVNSNDIILR